MKTSDYGRQQITRREGKRLKAYRDSVGVLTIGVGHTSAAGAPAVTADLTITDAECDEILSRDLAKFETAINASVKVALAQNEFDALVSFCFNIGQGGFMRSTVLRDLNDGDRASAADAFLMWNKPPEIMGRRHEERVQFMTSYKALGVPQDVPSTPAKTAAAAPVQAAPQRQPDDPGTKPAAPTGNWLSNLIAAIFGGKKA